MDVNVEECDPKFMEYALKRSLISRNKLAIILKGADNKTLYCCVECAVRYEEKEKLELHLCTHNKEYRYLCGICGTGLKRKEHLDRHTMEHLQVRPHVCTVCRKAFKRKEHLNIHQTTHYGHKTHICTLCDRSFHRKDHLQKHLQTHSKHFSEQNLCSTDDELMEIKCEVIDDEMKQEVGEDMNHEIEIEDAESFDNGYSNGESQESTSDTQEIRTPPESARPFICQICFKSYKRKDHLKIHSWTHMKKDKECSDCGKVFHKEELLLSHKRVCMQVHLKQLRPDRSGEDDHDSSEDYNNAADNSLLVERVYVEPIATESRPHECVICKRRFKRKQHLKVHANVHLKQAPTIWCSLCNEGFHNNDHFERHQCIPQSDPGENTEDEHVQIIPQDAKKENNNPTQFLEQEMLILDPEIEPPAYVVEQDEKDIPVPQKVFVCKYCLKPFKRKDHYKIHLHIHTGVKSFFCEDCGKGFYRKDHLQKHSQVHAKYKPKCKKQLPDLLPISKAPKKEIKPEITIHAPSNSKLRVPLQIKVPYQMVMSSDDGQQRTVTIDPQDDRQHEVFA